MYTPAEIVVVDDDGISLTLIASCLSKAGYQCRSFRDSSAVIPSSRDNPPDLFLLDLLMPDPDGIKLCSQIKSDPVLKDIPVIFLTSAEDSDQKVKAFGAGAVDYITKPINAVELNLRIKTHLELFFARQELLRYAHQMEQLAQERAKQLLHADRLALLGTLAAGIAHEINNPTAFISGNIQTLEKFWEVLEKEMPSVEKCFSGPDREKIGFISREMPDLIKGVREGVARIKKIVDSLTLFARKDESAKKEKFIFHECLAGALVLCQKILKDRVTVEQRVDPGIELFGVPQQIEQVLVNLIVNAVDAMAGSQAPVLSISASRSGDKAKVIVADNGPGVQEALSQKIWDPFFTTKGPGKGTGLGLAIVRSIIQQHAGAVLGHNRPEGGYCVEIILPLAAV